MNLNRLFQVIILLGFVFFFAYLLLTQQVSVYVHPRIVPYLQVSVFCLFMMAVWLAKDILQPSREKTDYLAFFILLVPLVLAWLVPPASFAQLPGEKNNLALQGQPIQLEPLKPWAGTLLVDKKNFLSALDGICAKPDSYLGKKVEIYGYVYRDQELETNQFVIARSLMTCCLADLQVIGIVCEYGQAEDLTEKGWYKVTGIVEKTNYQGQDSAKIVLEKAVKTAKPKDEYIYP